MRFFVLLIAALGVCASGARAGSLDQRSCARVTEPTDYHDYESSVVMDLNTHNTAEKMIHFDPKKFTPKEADLLQGTFYLVCQQSPHLTLRDAVQRAYDGYLIEAGPAVVR
jgi:hypothetical protein